MPLISCLTATLNRLPQLKEAIRCYCDQTYPCRELVIVTDGSALYRRAVEAFIRSLEREDIRLIVLEGAHTLGRIRNIAMQAAAGDIVCQWDDDDLYHPLRLASQAERMIDQKADACFLTDQLHYFWETREMFWVDWRSHPGEDIYKLIPGTLMMFRDSRFSYPEEGDAARAGEDFVFLEAIYRAVDIAQLQDAGHLYVYTFHGANTYDQAHHQALPDYRGADRTFVEARQETLLKALEYYRLAFPYQVKAANHELILTYSGHGA